MPSGACWNGGWRSSARSPDRVRHPEPASTAVGGGSRSDLAGRCRGVGVVVDVTFSSMFFVHVLVRDMHVLQCRMVVLVHMGRKQMGPVLPLVQVVRHVVVLVPVLQGLVLMIAPRPRHRAHPFSDRHSTAGCPTRTSGRS